MPAELTIRTTRISPTHHQLSYTRPDGTGETITLESKCCLYHDFLHFALESEAGLMKSFFGHLANAKSYAELSSMDASYRDEIGMTERVVGVLTGAIKSDIAPEAAIGVLKNWLDAYNEPVPAWFTADLFVRVKDHMRRLVGEWTKMKFGETMTMVFKVR